MKIAFVGKGGSGKSTLTALFIKYLEHHWRGDVLAIDADINMNLAGLLGVSVNESTLLSRPDVTSAVREHLRGTNERIVDASKFLPTTPPGRGSNLIESISDKAITPYSVTVTEHPRVRLLTVGTYDSDGIGQTCYHSHLFTVENLLSHTVTGDTFRVVCDMVAGTDAFAYSLHLQFDAIFLIAEPTPESVEVCRLYTDLARAAGIEQLVWLIGNKIEDQDDLDYIRESVGRDVVTYVPSIPALKKARQKGQSVDKALLTPEVIETMKAVERHASAHELSFADRLRLLHRLHEKLTEKQWVKQGYGDVSGQIDREFHLLQPAQPALSRGSV